MKKKKIKSELLHSCQFPIVAINFVNFQFLLAALILVIFKDKRIVDDFYVCFNVWNKLMEQPYGSCTHVRFETCQFDVNSCQEY